MRTAGAVIAMPAAAALLALQRCALPIAQQRRHRQTTDIAVAVADADDAGIQVGPPFRSPPPHTGAAEPSRRR